MGKKDKQEKPTNIAKVHKDDEELDKAARAKESKDKAVNELIKWRKDVDSE